MNWSSDDNRYMGLALQLAKKGQFTARPNPMVGCVIVNDNKIVGQGWHQKYGQAHAEINALSQAGIAAKGATCYVTLEPCSHQGKTAPCAKALIKAGVNKVIVAMEDPNPTVKGNGFQLLQEAGIEVESGLLEKQALEINKGFVSRFKTGAPWVTLKLAASLDGRTALANGESKWITASDARFDVQKLRAKQDAIITGAGTVLADNPGLDVRAGDDKSSAQFQWFSSIESFSQPIRILLDNQGRANLKSKFFDLPNATSEQAKNVWWITNKDDSFDKTNHPNIKLIKPVELNKLLKLCAEQGLNNVLVEAGHKLAGSFIKENLVDELIVYISPKLMGNKAKGMFDLSIESMADSFELELKNVIHLGNDLRLVYQPRMSSFNR